jgi:tRNA nucleotidyltransferase (CCA-adding enzyme)
MSIPLPPDLKEILTQTPELQRAFLVGGCVRDWLLGLPVQDYDVEVFGLSYEQLVRVLGRFGRTDLVGKSFGIVKLTTGSRISHDFAIPRRDSKIAPGHKGFEIVFDADITPTEAASRRDFTVNSLMYDPRQERVLDFFGGTSDLSRRILRHTSSAFIDDPLRVLRGMQLAARFGLTPATETVQLCRSIQSSYGELAGERVREEWFKWAQKSSKPSRGLLFLEATGWVRHFPEIAALRQTPQDPGWHPEGDVFIHTCHACDALAELAEWRQADPESRLVYMMAVLAHDFGKATTTHQAEKDGRPRIVSPGHEEAGGPLTERFLERIQTPRSIVERILPLVTHHLAHLQKITDRSVRRLARRLEPENIQGLCLVMTADHFGRPPKPRVIPDSIRALAEKAKALAVQERAPKPILLGRHLLELELKPGPDFGVILDAAYEAQLEGQFLDLEHVWSWLADQPDLPLTTEARRALSAKIAGAKEGTP